jgi:acid phosphatase
MTIMHRRALLFVLAVALALAGCTAVTREPANLDRRKQEIRAYVASGRYQHDVAAVAAQAAAWIQQRAAARAPGERLAMVFDLDETLLSNWPFIDDEDLGGSDAAWDTWLAAGKAPAIESVREVYRSARKMGIDILFLSSRREHLRASTEKNLRAIDCGDWAALIMESEQWKGTAAAFKTAERAQLTAEGRVIIANVGDQESDLAGGFAERTFKLPDPFYFTP